MNVDIAALRAIERDKDIPFDTVLEAIETALLTAYKHTEGHQAQARIDIDRKSGLVRVMAQGLAEDGQSANEWDDTPEGFGRIAATTARQVILQRLRDAEHERTFGEFSAKEGEIVAGVIQRDVRANARGVVVVSAGRHGRGCCRPPSRSPVSATSTASGFAATWSGSPGAAGAPRSPCPAPTRTWSASCSRSRCRSWSTGQWRSARLPGRPATVRRSRCGFRRLSVNPKGACIGPMGQRVRNVMSELAGEKIDIIDWSRRPGGVRRTCVVASSAKVSFGHSARRTHQDRAGRGAGLPALPGDR